MTTEMKVHSSKALKCFFKCFSSVFQVFLKCFSSIIINSLLVNDGLNSTVTLPPNPDFFRLVWANSKRVCDRPLSP